MDSEATRAHSRELIEDCGGSVAKAFRSAITKGRCDLLKCLARNLGANVSGRDSGGLTPLHLAAEHGNCEVIRVLVRDLRVSVDSRDICD